MLFVNSQGTVISEENLRAMNPLVSFPLAISAADVAPFGYSILQEVAQPAPTSQFYTVTPGAPAENNGVWTQTWIQTAMPLAQAQQIQSNAVTAACGAAIVSGFTSSALGAPHTYPSNIIDQQNLAASVLSSLLPNLAANWTTPFWCSDSNGNWAWVPHTAAQIQQAGTDGKAAVLAYQSENATLQAQIAAATTVDEAAAVVWTTA